MSASSDASKLNDEAAFWVARLHSDQATNADEAAFADWIAGAAERRAAYDSAERTWRAFDSLRADPMARSAFSGLREARRGASRRVFLGGGLAAAAAAGAFAYFGVRGESYATEVGELRRARLDDGTTISLNTNTLIRVRYDDAQRRIWLDRGQAHFAVARDPDRPFRVFVGEEEVRALGTAFEVRREGDRMRVILEEGVVALYRKDQEAVIETTLAPLVLRPGQAADITPDAETAVAEVDLRRTGAWRYGQMIFDAEPLAAAVAEINRYHRRKIRLDDPDLGDIQISGVFQTGRPEAFADVLTSAFPIRVANEDEREIRLAPASEPSRGASLSQD